MYVYIYIAVCIYSMFGYFGPSGFSNNHACGRLSGLDLCSASSSNLKPKRAMKLHMSYGQYQWLAKRTWILYKDFTRALTERSKNIYMYIHM